MSVLDTERKFSATLTFEKSKDNVGACKYAYFGESSAPIFLGSESNKVCIKEAFYIAPETGHHLIYDGPKQGELLMGEINCARWANALMRLVYDFIKDEDAKRGKPSFPIPDLRYVNVALAVSTQKDRATYLLEEVIEEPDGGFRKYINNTIAVPLSSNDPRRKETGAFLAFTQHVQYLKTGKQAFVSDQQGGSTGTSIQNSLIECHHGLQEVSHFFPTLKLSHRRKFLSNV
jgi:hypothetical protein